MKKKTLGWGGEENVKCKIVELGSFLGLVGFELGLFGFVIFGVKWGFSL